jgi:hypothetical protein
MREIDAEWQRYMKETDTPKQRLASKSRSALASTPDFWIRPLTSVLATASLSTGFKTRANFLKADTAASTTGWRPSFAATNNQ